MAAGGAACAIVGGALLTAAVAVAGPVPPAYAGGSMTFVVTTASDAGTGGCDAAGCTLREAIDAANALPEGTASTIAFAIPGAVPVTIEPVGVIPDLVRPMTIDGTTQPGYAGTPVVEVDLGSSGRIRTWNHDGVLTIRGLALNGSSSHAIEIGGSGYTVVERNFVGTDPSGTVARPNRGSGIRVDALSPPYALVQDNVLSGNGSAGIEVDGGAIVTVRRNLVGTDATGTVALPNRRAGVDWGTASGALVDNVVAGNTGTGILLNDGPFFSRMPYVGGNLVGTDATGRAPLGNGGDGIRVSTHYVRIGGPDDPNVIAANGGDGIVIESAQNFVLENNRIGTDLRGTARLGNRGAGIVVREGDDPWATEGTIGTSLAGAANRIAFNRGPGIAIADPTSAVTIRGNVVHANRGIAVDLGADGVTPNDAGDADTGPNGRDNFPVVEAATTGGGTTVAGTLDALPSTTYVVDVATNQACDPSGHGELQRTLGSFTVTTDEGGHAAFERTFSRATPAGHVVVAVATRVVGGWPGPTSEVSPCTTVSG